MTKTLMTLLLLWAAPAAAKTEKAVFAGGCFWCMEPPFDRTEGVLATISGYTGGKVDDPSYEQVSGGRTGHYEAVEVSYDPAKVSYETLLDVFWRSIDPTQADGQFADRGSQYLTAVFVSSPEQRKAAEASKARLAASGKFDRPIAVKILPAAKFWPAEEYHQDYYKKNAGHYERYSEGSGRKGFLKKTWGEEAGPIRPYDAAAFAADRKAGKTVVLEFYAGWCPICREQKASLETLRARGRLKGLTVYVADFDRERALAAQHRVLGQGVLLVFKGETETARAAGVASVEAVDELLRKGA